MHRQREFIPFSGTPHRVTDGPIGVSGQAPPPARSSPPAEADPEVVEVTDSLDDVGTLAIDMIGNSDDFGEQYVEAMVSCAKSMEEMATVAAAWIDRVPDHRYTRELRSSIDEFVENVVAKQSYIESKLDVAGSYAEMEAEIRAAIDGLDAVKSTWASLKSEYDIVKDGGGDDNAGTVVAVEPGMDDKPGKRMRRS